MINNRFNVVYHLLCVVFKQINMENKGHILKMEKLKFGIKNKIMIELENKSYRGMLVEVIVKSFIKENIFESVDGLKEILQERLNLNLKFETNVSNIENKNEYTFGKISFEDENGVLRMIDFTITGSSVVV